MNKVLGLIQHYILHKATAEELRIIRLTLDNRHVPQIIHLSALKEDPQLLRLIKNNEKLMAVKYVKDATGLGLKESKDFVDRLHTEIANAEFEP